MKEDIRKINRLLFISVFSVITFSLAVFGITYAFFSVNISGNNMASSIIINVANLGTVVFTDGEEINAINVYPVEEEDRITKTFTVTSIDNSVYVEYEINLIVYNNEFLNIYGNEFTYTLRGTSNGPGGINDVVATAKNEIVPSTGKYVIGVGKFPENGGVTHTYTFTIGLNEMSLNQNSNQGKNFSGKLEISANKKYTRGGSEWSN